MQDVADACRTGAATDIIFGLALGYKSCIVPTIVIAITIYVANSLAGMYGIACAALGMLATLATGGFGSMGMLLGLGCVQSVLCTPPLAQALNLTL